MWSSKPLRTIMEKKLGLIMHSKHRTRWAFHIIQIQKGLDNTNHDSASYHHAWDRRLQHDHMAKISEKNPKQLFNYSCFSIDNKYNTQQAHNKSKSFRKSSAFRYSKPYRLTRTSCVSCVMTCAVTCASPRWKVLRWRLVGNHNYNQSTKTYLCLLVLEYLCCTYMSRQ